MKPVLCIWEFVYDCNVCSHMWGRKWSVCVCVYLMAPTTPVLSNGKISSGVPAGPTVAYLCGFICELPGGAPGPTLTSSDLLRTQDGGRGRRGRSSRSRPVWRHRVPAAVTQHGAVRVGWFSLLGLLIYTSGLHHVFLSRWSNKSSELVLLPSMYTT